MNALRLGIIGIVLACSACGAAQPSDPATGKPLPADPPVSAKIHKGTGWAIAAPGDWSPDSLPLQPPRVLHLNGIGRAGIPMMDGTLAPLQIGLELEEFAKGATTAERQLDRFQNELKTTRMFKLRGDPQVENLDLADGTKAQLLSVEMDKIIGSRVSFYFKLVCSHPDGRVLVATAWAVGGNGGAKFIRNSGILDLLKAHVTSLVLDDKKVDEAKLKKVYSTHNWHLGNAVRLTAKGNKLLEQMNYVGAAPEFAEALKLCPDLSAAHNGLAWALIHSEAIKPDDLTKAVKHAELAAELSERRDPDSLDTLGLAYFKKGDKAKAIETIKEALKLQPMSEELQKRLEEFGSDK